MTNSYFIATYQDNNGAYRQAFAKSEKGETANSFLVGRGHKLIKDKPAEGFDSEGYYAPIIANEVAFKDIKKNIKTKGLETIENLADLLRENGFIVYKKKKK